MIAYSVQRRVALLELCAPPGNAISFALLEELCAALRRAIDEDHVRGIVIHGGSQRFSVGADLAIFKNIQSGDDALRASRVFQEAFAAIENSPRPVLAAVAGHVLGGGLELAMSCHARLATDGGRFSLPEVNLGINPGAGGTQRLPRLVGLDTALEMLLTGRPVDVKTAIQKGLIDAACPAEKLIETAVDLMADDSGPLADALRDLERRRTGQRADKLADAQANGAAFARAEAQVAKLRPELVGPRKILQAVRTGVEESFEAGLACEQEMFRQCMASPATRNKIHVMFSKLETARLPELENVKAPSLRRAGVLGMGTMGTGIAQALLMAGLRVTACDQSAPAVQAAGQRIAESIQRRMAQGKLAPAASLAALERFHGTTDWLALGGSDLIVEAVFEDLEVKRAAIARLEEICPPEAIIATNTSTLNLDALAAGMRHPDRLIGMHFFHPAQQMPLVEVVRRDSTPPEMLATTLALAKAMGKTPVVSRNREGFIVNRLFVPYLTEAFWLLEEGASPESIDRAMAEFGFAMGPLQLIDMSGIDILALTQPILAKAFPWHGELSPIAWSLVNSGLLGQKTGAGVYQYAPGDRTPRPHAAAQEIIADVRRRRAGPVAQPADEQIVERLMLRMAAEAHRLMAEGIARCEADVDVAMVLGTGLADFRGGVLKYAADLGSQKVQAALRRLSEVHGPRYGCGIVAS